MAPTPPCEAKPKTASLCLTNAIVTQQATGDNVIILASSTETTDTKVGNTVSNQGCSDIPQGMEAMTKTQEYTNRQTD